ncbi:MAG: transcription termination factor NusA [Nitrospirales bacterium]|nr:transcription termination factor NusA [Nitrospirales bacterium]
MGRELLTVIEQIGREKGIDAKRILEAVESALLTAAKKRYGAAENIQVRIDRKSGEIEAISLKKIVNEVTNPQSEVSLAEARKVDSEAELGDEIGAVIEIEEFGRIAAQTAKQVIFQKVREAEWEVVQRDYTARLGDLVNGIILGQERRNYIVDLGKTEAILPAHEQIPRETYRRGDRVKAYLLEVKRTLRDVQVILSRTHPNFIVKLFEAEVPEIAEKIVEIKGVVREPGDRTKIAVVSRDRAVDPVGACVGMKGSRVQAVVRELRGEKIDIVAWTPDSRVFISEALNPAVIEKVGVDEEKKSALVVVADSQLSLAIGRNGQNVRLAAKLTGWKIDIIGSSEYEKERVVRDQETRAAIAHQLQEQHAKLVDAESAAAAAQQEAPAPEGSQAAGQAESGDEEKAVG